MKIIRFRDPSGHIQYGEPINEKSARLIEGDIFGIWTITDRSVGIEKLLAPIVPPTILCIGLNYRAHAEETGARIPEYPVVFIKAINALHNPGDSIIIPKVAPGEVDYECEIRIDLCTGPRLR